MFKVTENIDLGLQVAYFPPAEVGTLVRASEGLIFPYDEPKGTHKWRNTPSKIQNGIIMSVQRPSILGNIDNFDVIIKKDTYGICMRRLTRWHINASNYLWPIGPTHKPILSTNSWNLGKKYPTILYLLWQHKHQILFPSRKQPAHVTGVFPAVIMIFKVKWKAHFICNGVIIIITPFPHKSH